MVLREREDVLGEPLTEEEVEELVERYRHSDCSRQINLGLLYCKFLVLLGEKDAIFE